MEVHRKYNLRSKKSQDIANKKNAGNLVRKVSDSNPKKVSKIPLIKPKKILERSL